MFRRVKVERRQQVTRDEFNNFGNFPTDTIDALVRGFLTDGVSVYEGFAVTPGATATTVNVGAGTLWKGNGEGYDYNEEAGFTVNFGAVIPPSGVKRVATIVVWGEEDPTSLTSRTILTDPVTRAVTAMDVSTEIRRMAEIGFVIGAAAPDPVPQPPAANQLAVAYVTLTSTGVDKIEMIEDNRIDSLLDHRVRLGDLMAWRTGVGQQIDTLRSDLAALAARILGTASLSFVNRIAADVAWAKELLSLPATYASYDTNHFLTNAKSDMTHPDWLARIEEGARYPYAAERDSQLGLLNQFDETVKQQNLFVLPAYDEVKRVSNWGNDLEVSIAQYTTQSVQMVKKTRTRERVRYGTPFIVCSNGFNWQQGDAINYADWTYRRSTGEVFEIMGYVDDEWILGGPAWSQVNHGVIRLRQKWVDTVEEEYWDTVNQDLTANGSIIANTFLNSQNGWLTSINLWLTRVGAAGDLFVYLTECHNDGSPNLKAVLGYSQVVVADLRANVRQKVPFDPIFLRQRRYAIILVTTGNHFVALTQNNKFAQGSFFVSSDIGWFQGDITRDLAFELNFAKFRSPRVEVNLNALELENGIAGIDLNADATIPDGTNIDWQIKLNNVWTSFEPVSQDGTSAFAGLPALLQFRAVLTGTTDVMPGFGVGSNSRVLTVRPRTDMREVSYLRTLSSPSTQITVEVRYEGWVNGRHTASCVLLTGGPAYVTPLSPAATVTKVAPDDPGARIVNYTFTPTAPGLTTFKIRINMNTDNALVTQHIAARTDIAA